MRTMSQDYIQYWQRFYPAQRGLRNRFGVRVEDGCCWAAIQIADGATSTFGKPHAIPVDLRSLPIYLRMIVDDHLLDYPRSDLGEILAGKKSFQEAWDCPPGFGVKGATVNLTVKLTA